MMMEQGCVGQKLDPMKNQAVQEALAALIKKMLGDDDESSEGETESAPELVAEAVKGGDGEESAEGEADEMGKGDSSLNDELKNYFNPKREPKRALMMTAMKIKGDAPAMAMGEQKKIKGKYLG